MILVKKCCQFVRKLPTTSIPIFLCSSFICIRCNIHYILVFSFSLEIAYLYSSIFYVIFALLDIINISSTIVPGLLSLFAQDGFCLPVVLLNLVALCLAFKPLGIQFL